LNPVGDTTQTRATVLEISSLTAQSVERFRLEEIHGVFESCRPNLRIELSGLDTLVTQESADFELASWNQTR